MVPGAGFDGDGSENGLGPSDFDLSSVAGDDQDGLHLTAFEFTSTDGDAQDQVNLGPGVDQDGLCQSDFDLSSVAGDDENILGLPDFELSSVDGVGQDQVNLGPEVVQSGLERDGSESGLGPSDSNLSSVDGVGSPELFESDFDFSSVAGDDENGLGLSDFEGDGSPELVESDFDFSSVAGDDEHGLGLYDFELSSVDGISQSGSVSPSSYEDLTNLSPSGASHGHPAVPNLTEIAKADYHFDERVYRELTGNAKRRRKQVTLAHLVSFRWWKFCLQVAFSLSINLFHSAGGIGHHIYCCFFVVCVHGCCLLLRLLYSAGGIKQLLLSYSVAPCIADQLLQPRCKSI